MTIRALPNQTVIQWLVYSLAPVMSLFIIVEGTSVQSVVQYAVSISQFQYRVWTQCHHILLLNILSVQNPTTCTNCEDRELANSRCIDCVENLCPNCVTAHERIRQTKGHKIISFEELQNNAVHDAIKCPSFCKIHAREVSSSKN